MNMWYYSNSFKLKFIFLTMELKNLHKINLLVKGKKAAVLKVSRVQFS